MRVPAICHVSVQRAELMDVCQLDGQGCVQLQIHSLKLE